MEEDPFHAEARPGWRLTERVRRGDPEAVAEAVRLHRGEVLRAALAAGLDPDAAEDATQATLLTFLETLPRFEGRSNVRTWLLGIARHKIQEIRRDGARARSFPDPSGAVDGVMDPVASWPVLPRLPDAELGQRETRRRRPVSGQGAAPPA